MIARAGMFTLIALAVLVTACESTRKIKEDVKNDATKRTIERARVHSAADIKAAYDKEGTDADETLLLFFNALLLIEEDQTAGYAAAAYLSRKNDQWSDPEGPTGVKPSQAASEGMGRIRDNPERARSYTGGKPTDYAVSNSASIVIEIKETRENSSTELKYFVWSSGKDNASPITLRSDGGKWYVDEWSSIQTGVRK
ncbi:MAG: hypothetical protein IPK87_08570 [Planctomycetes bacterium]|nr:hypothetical protein [Planctomycetota bacterium]